MVLANKCDLLDNIDQSFVISMESELQQTYPSVVYKEISVLFNIEVLSSMQEFAALLLRNKESYV